MFCAYGPNRAAVVALGGLAALVADLDGLAEVLGQVDPDLMD
jgi:hypothetical protein